ncbi:hypothetical protein [Sphingomonas sp.]|jgi:hypothetical protein|uniref:hypothetical protein n=1 Tax=Sphingomonas sp. TaxID=28214 RepID=UPI00183F6AE2|nr:hypothetical protein [Sphingomonas sp.]MBA3511143.1 hypothetical protein [Sphingomonas sp.]
MTFNLPNSRAGRAALLTGLALALLACSPAGEPASNRGMARTMQSGMPMMRDMPQGMMAGEGMMGPGMMQDMRPIHGLLASHDKIQRRVEDIPNGVRTITTSKDPEVAEMIRTHVRQMKARYSRGQPIRNMDPVFRELFRNRHKASLDYEDIPGGIRVTHTSDDPQVVLLIRQHARRFVSEAAKEGMSRAMRPTPLPEGYRAPAR